ncbi:glycosyltransferase 8 domain-containing protein 2 isoform X1 [Chiloscyllium punctatum]|uniref:glycosyltransferase 8 domain-containing protein 2 isoform X1 n=2 Tax=Chiloscyllium punctatum TaxID=137246 RepID=UPI003B637112
MAFIRKFNQGLLFLVILMFCLVLYNKFHKISPYKEEAAEEPESPTVHSTGHTINQRNIPATDDVSAPDDVIPIIICAAEDRLGGTIATINSIYSNTNADIIFYIITLRDSLIHISKWIENTKLKGIHYRVLEFNAAVLQGKVRPDSARPELLQPLNFVRYFIPFLIRDHEKVIYLDDDVIIQGDIQDLYNTVLKPGHAAAFSTDCDLTSTHEMVRSMGMQTTYMGHLDYRKPTVRDLGINPTTCSFNVGVFVANVTEWKRQRITKQLEKWLVANVEENLYSSALAEGVVTPPMLIVFHNQHSLLNPLWHIRHLGWSPDARYSEHFLSEAKLLHWNGRYKPWDYPTAHVEFWERWYLPDPTGHFRLVRPNN